MVSLICGIAAGFMAIWRYYTYKETKEEAYKLMTIIWLILTLGNLMAFIGQII